MMMCWAAAGQDVSQLEPKRLRNDADGNVDDDGDGDDDDDDGLGWSLSERMSEMMRCWVGASAKSRCAGMEPQRNDADGNCDDDGDDDEGDDGEDSSFCAVKPSIIHHSLLYVC